MKFTDRKLLVVGDIILDEYIHGEATRISPEAPVPIVKFREAEYRLGGAGNVAANIATLGGNAHIIGVAAIDRGSERLGHLFRTHGLLYSLFYRHGVHGRTTIKTRITANGQQLCRVDTECCDPLPESLLANLVSNIRDQAGSACAIVVSDYAKGVITPEVMDTIRSCAESAGIPIFLDPKVSHADTYRSRYSGYPLEVITPNHHEAEGLGGKYDLYDTATSISARYAAKNVLITCGESGMTLVSHIPNAPMKRTDIPTAAKEVFDVSGAGDTVIAALTLAVVSGYSVEQAARLANLAAGVVVGKRGTATVSYDELAAAGGAEITLDSITVSSP